ncbi:phage tail tape measure protein [Endozoicomonas sp. 4G]|uniref:phage tail tape measure protein n=1 Tax=Endozoicomonas sp. 4G TaxID=2872754 RepID=UPI002078C843|nr:phage tail tape measure protein [Endozoicomonas sp. 4G]
MADLQSTIEIVIGAIDETAAGFAAAIDNVNNMAGSIEDATQPMADLTAGILAADAAMLALGVTMLKWSTDEAAKFQTATSEINTLIGLSPELMGEFTDDILAYGSTSTQTFEQINGAVYNAISAGVAYGDALDVVRQAELMAVAGKSELNEAMTLLVPTLNAYGESTEEAGRYSDVFFKTVALGVTTIPELSSSMGQLAPTAAAVGVPIETLGAALATLTFNGIGTSEAATGLKAALSNIIVPSKGASDAAAELGVAFGVSALETKGLEGLLQDLYTATGGNVDQMARFFGSTEALNAVLALTSNSSEVFTRNLEAMDGAAGSTDAAYKIMADTFENVNKVLGNAVDVILIKIGSELLPEMTNLSKGLTDVFNGIGEGIDQGSFDVPLEIVEGFIADLAAMLATAAENLPEALALVDWSGFEDAMEGVNEALSGLFDGVDLTTPEGLAEAIQLAVDAFTGMINVTSGVMEGLQPLFDTIGWLVQSFADLDPEVQSAIGYFLGLSTTANIVAGTVGSLSGALGAAGAAKGLVGSFAALGPVIAGASVALAGFEVGKYIAEVTGLDEALEEWLLGLKDIPPLIGASDDAVARSEATLKSLGSEIGLTNLTMEEFNDLVNSGKLVWDETTGKWIEAESAAKDLGASFDEIGVDGLVAEFNLLNPALQLTADGTVEASDATDALSTTTRGLISVFDAATGKWIDIADAADKGADSVHDGGEELKAAAEKAELMTRASADFILGWEKIQSAERVAIFEARADIAVAQIEADASRTIAAFDAMSSSFQNTGDVLTELFGIWAGLDSGFDKNKIAEWIEREYKIREDLAKSQIALVEAEIRRMEAQTALLEKGGVEIKISSDGLEPALEAFMFSVVDKVRVQIAGSYEDFLLGCGS